MIARVLGASTLAVLLAAGAASAQDSYRSGYVRTVEQGVTLQRATESSSEAAVPNLPFMAGDRIWTDGMGRVELVFADGSVLRLDSRSKLDFVSEEGGRRATRVVLRLWSGSAVLHYRDDRRSPEFTVETPEAAVAVQGAGTYRLDVDPGQARVAVIAGEATVEADGRTRVNEGQQVLVREGQVERGPEQVDASLGDDFMRWDDDLQQQLADGGGDPYLPEEVSPYAADFNSNGRWGTIPEYGNVWYPQVDVGWEPYTRGYWAWTSFGWTWVPNERWGWATAHYGRWGYGSRGWYWIPGASWGPAWVSWSIGNDYVGWCPLGWGDRPVTARGFRRFPQDRGRAVPRGGVLADNDRGAWSYLRRADMGQRDVARRRVEGVSPGGVEVHASPAAHTRLSRDLRVVDAAEPLGGRGSSGARAVPRNVRTRPGIGDTVPELRGDNMTNIPHPMPRTHRERDPAEEGRDDTAVRSPGSSGTSRRYYPDAGVGGQRQGEAPPAAGDDGARVRGGATDRSRDTVRPLFGPLSRSRAEDAREGNGRDGGVRDGSRDGARVRDGARDGAVRDNGARDSGRDDGARERQLRDSWTRPRSDDGGAGRTRSRDDAGVRDGGGARERDNGGRDAARERDTFRPAPRPERHDDGGSRPSGNSGASSGGGGGARPSGPPPQAHPSGGDNGARPRGGDGDHARPRDHHN